MKNFIVEPLTKEELQEVKNTLNPKQFKNVVIAQRDLFMVEIEKKNEELKELRSVLKELKEYTKLGKRTPKDTTKPKPTK